MRRCPHCALLMPREQTLCTCGYEFSGAEPEASITPADILSLAHRDSKADAGHPRSGSERARLIESITTFLLMSLFAGWLFHSNYLYSNYGLYEGLAIAISLLLFTAII